MPQHAPLGISGIDRAELDWHGGQRRNAEEQAPGKEVSVRQRDSSDVLSALKCTLPFCSWYPMGYYPEHTSCGTVMTR
eukprot:5103977-Pyramimonas_sp.AAC.1